VAPGIRLKSVGRFGDGLRSPAEHGGFGVGQYLFECVDLIKGGPAGEAGADEFEVAAGQVAGLLLLCFRRTAHPWLPRANPALLTTAEPTGVPIVLPRCCPYYREAGWPAFSARGMPM